MRWFGLLWTMGGLIEDTLFHWPFKRVKRRRRIWDIPPLALMWVVWNKEIKRVFEGIEHDFVS